LLAAGPKAPARRDMVLHGGGEQNDAANYRCAAAPAMTISYPERRGPNNPPWSAAAAPLELRRYRANSSFVW